LDTDLAQPNQRRGMRLMELTAGSGLERSEREMGSERTRHDEILTTPPKLLF
jgi:hypothetical protein